MSAALDSNIDSRPLPPLGASTIVLDHRASLGDQLFAAEHEFDSHVWLDFSAIETINSAELSALIRFSLRLRQLDKSVFLCHVGPHLNEIFEITRFRAASTY